jgi:hypothetical protein
MHPIEFLLAAAQFTVVWSGAAAAPGVTGAPLSVSWR